MDFEFYNVTTPATGAKRALIPLQRMMRRLLRPMLHRLRDLLTILSQRQHEMTAHVVVLAARVEALEAQLKKANADSKALELEHLAVVRRLAQLEDLLLQSLTVRAEVDARNIPGLPTLAATESSNGSFRKAS